MVIFCSLPVPRSLAVTWTMPLASMSKVTSICGTPRGAGAMPESSKVPSGLFCWAISRSPWKTWMSTDGWLSSAVEKTSLRLVGIAVFRSMSLVNSPPLVSMPSERGVTSMRSTSLRSPLRTPAWSDAPSGDDLVGVHALVRLLAAGELLDERGHGRHPGGATDEDHVVDVRQRDPGVLDDVLERLPRAVEQVLGHLLELRAGEALVEVDRAVLGHREVLERDVRRGRARQLLLRLLSRVTQTLHRDAVLGQVDAGGVLHRRQHVVDDALVPVVATELVVARRGLDLDGGEAVLRVLAHLEEGDVEGAATEVEDEDELVLATLVQAVRQCGRGRLVDDPQDVEPRDLAGLLGGLALVVVEVGRHGDHRVGDGLAEVRLGVALELLEDAGADLLRGVPLAVDLVRLPVGADVALDRADGAVGVRHGLALGDLADEHLTALGERDDGRGGATALGVRDDVGLAALEDGDGAVRGAEVDADCTGHGGVSLVGHAVECSGLKLARTDACEQTGRDELAFTSTQLRRARRCSRARTGRLTGPSGCAYGCLRGRPWCRRRSPRRTSCRGRWRARWAPRRRQPGAGRRSTPRSREREG